MNGKSVVGGKKGVTFPNNRSSSSELPFLGIIKWVKKISRKNAKVKLNGLQKVPI